MATDTTNAIEQAYWKEERIQRLMDVLASQRDSVYAQSFVQRLARQSTLQDKQKMLVAELPALVNHKELTILWQGKEISSQLALHDVLLTFLHHEGVTQNIPTGEQDTPEEAAERDRLATLFGQGKFISDIVIENRGQR